MTNSSDYVTMNNVYYCQEHNDSQNFNPLGFDNLTCGNQVCYNTQCWYVHNSSTNRRVYQCKYAAATQTVQQSMVCANCSVPCKHSDQYYVQINAAIHQLDNIWYCPTANHLENYDPSPVRELECAGRYCINTRCVIDGADTTTKVCALYRSQSECWAYCPEYCTYANAYLYKDSFLDQRVHSIDRAYYCAYSRQEVNLNPNGFANTTAIANDSTDSGNFSLCGSLVCPQTLCYYQQGDSARQGRYQCLASSYEAVCNAFCGTACKFTQAFYYYHAQRLVMEYYLGARHVSANQYYCPASAEAENAPFVDLRRAAERRQLLLYSAGGTLIGAVLCALSSGLLFRALRTSPSPTYRPAGRHVVALEGQADYV